ncbi:hypothetical protein Tco_1173544 [Tanacetum coccineum]
MDVAGVATYLSDDSRKQVLQLLSDDFHPPTLPVGSPALLPPLPVCLPVLPPSGAAVDRLALHVVIPCDIIYTRENIVSCKMRRYNPLSRRPPRREYGGQPRRLLPEGDMGTVSEGGPRTRIMERVPFERFRQWSEMYIYQRIITLGDEMDGSGVMKRWQTQGYFMMKRTVVDAWTKEDVTLELAFNEVIPIMKFDCEAFGSIDDAQCTICLGEYQEKEMLRGVCFGL